MIISNTAKYALRAVIYLAINGSEDKRIGIKKISKDLDIPAPFLAKILQNLSKHKLLVSTKGPNGGFGLGRDAYEISFLDVIELVDGLDVFEECIFGLKICINDKSHKEICPVHEKSKPVRAELYDLFKNQIIGEIAQKIKETGGSIEI